MKFRYTAQRHDGEVYRGVADAADRFDLYRIIRREGAEIIAVEEQRGRSMLSFAYWNAKLSTVPEYEKVVFARNLSAMLKAGLALSRALSVIERQTKNVRFTDVLSEVASRVRRGDQLNAALGAYPNVFSRLFVAMVKAGEESGDLAGSLSVIGEQMERAYTLKKKVRGALIYPAIIVIAIIAITVLMLTQVVPTLAQTFEELGAELPASTQTIIAISDFLVQNTIAAISIVVLAIASFILGLRTNVGRRTWEWVLLHIPLVGGIIREVNAARVSRTLGSLLASGVDMVTALSIAEEVLQNSYFTDVVRTARADVQHGKPLSHAFSANEHLFPPLVGEMMAVGEETGQLSEMLTRLAEFYEEEVGRKTKDMSTVIEPFLMVIIGIAVGFFAISMIAPIYQLSENI